MSKESELFEQPARGGNTGNAEVRFSDILGGIGEAIGGFVDGMGQVWDALAPAASLGSEEISRALFTSNGYVFHGDSFAHEAEPMHGPTIEPQKEIDQGREM